MFDDVIRLVAKHYPDLLTETHLHLAKVRRHRSVQFRRFEENLQINRQSVLVFLF